MGELSELRGEGGEWGKGWRREVGDEEGGIGDWGLVKVAGFFCVGWGGGSKIRELEGEEGEEGEERKKKVEEQGEGERT